MPKNTLYPIPYTLYQKGQALLVILLVMSVALTIGLALLSRTTTDISISRQQEESARAFYAAEAGIEEVLRTGASFAEPNFGGGTSVNATISEATGYSQFLFPDEIKAGESATLWLNGHDGDGNFNPTVGGQYQGGSFNLCWDGQAVEVSIYYKEGSEDKVVRGAYDPDAGSHGNNFSAPDGSSCLNLAHKKTINFSSLGVPGGSILLFASIKPYYTVAKIGVEASVGATFPSQGDQIESAGSLGDIQRKVRVFRSWPVPASVFDYGVFSGGSLSK